MRQRIIQRTNLNLIEALIDNIIQRHTAKGFRDGSMFGCQCEYCLLKAESYLDISTAGKRWFRRLMRRSATDQERDDPGYFIWIFRKRLRKKWRNTLREAKQLL